jgi:hypothetical protein
MGWMSVRTPFEGPPPSTRVYFDLHVMALRTKIQTFSRKQDVNKQMHIKADLDIWNSTMGMC